MSLQPYFPPGDDENGKLLSFICDGEKGCGHQDSTWVSFKVDNYDHKATCPECGEVMTWDAGSSAPALRTTDTKKSRARSMTKKNEKLKETQWDNHDTGYDLKDIRSGRKKVRNPTKGGPLDLNSKFHKRTK